MSGSTRGSRLRKYRRRAYWKRGKRLENDPNDHRGLCCDRCHRCVCSCRRNECRLSQALQKAAIFFDVYRARPEDRLGTALPVALPANAVVRLLLPAGETTRPTIVGAKAWPGEADRYIAIVCLGGNPDVVFQKICSTRNAPLRVYLGVIIGGGTRLSGSGPIRDSVASLWLMRPN